MKTSAQQQPGLLPEPTARFTGTLIEHAEVRHKMIDAEGHTVPVLCLEVELDGALHNRLHAEQPFLPGQHVAAEYAARRYRKGTRISVDAPVVGLRMVATNATHIHVHQPEDTPA